MKLDLFLAVYTAAAILGFYILRGEGRRRWLAFWSLVYIASLDKTACIAVLIVSLLTWSAGKIIGHQMDAGRRGAARAVAAAGIAALAGTLIFMKYVPQALSGTPFREGWNARLRYLLVPVGFSFYSFQAISYLSDLCSGKCRKAAGFSEFMLYMFWFPKFISGPIERAGVFLPQSDRLGQIQFKDARRWTRAFMYLLYGFLMKYVVADRIAGMIEAPFADPGAHSSGMLAIAAVLYTIQIYCDFAGYSYAAIGFSLMFGLSLRDNFMMPYCATNITQFWRRWHMSLSSWLRDYIYIPLGGNRKGFARKLLNLSVVFIICGLWHGSSLNFLVWGIMHACFCVVDNLLAGLRGSRTVHMLRNGISGRVLTLLMVTVAWIVFRADSLASAGIFLGRVVSLSGADVSFSEELAQAGICGWEMWILVIGTLFVICCDLYSEKKSRSFPEILSDMSLARRCWFVYLAVMVLFVFGMYGLGANSRLIYMQF